MVRNGRNGRNGWNGRNGRMAGSFRQGTSRCQSSFRHGTSRCQSSTVMFEIGVSPVRSPTRSYIIKCVTLRSVANRLYKINHLFPKPDFAKELLLAVSNRFITCKHEQKDKRKVLPPLIAPIGREAKSSGRCIIILVVPKGFVKGRQRRQHVEEDEPIVVALLGISGGVVYFDRRQVRLVFVRIARGRAS